MVHGRTTQSGGRGHDGGDAGWRLVTFAFEEPTEAGLIEPHLNNVRLGREGKVEGGVGWYNLAAAAPARLKVPSPLQVRYCPDAGRYHCTWSC